jgi:hypothetical protein
MQNDEDLIKFLRDKTHMARFGQGEIREILERLRSEGWDIVKAPSPVIAMGEDSMKLASKPVFAMPMADPATAVDGPQYHVALSGEIERSDAVNEPVNAQVEGGDVPDEDKII